MRHTLECDGWPVGALSVENRGEGRYFVGCLCVIPKYQGRGIGTEAFRHMMAKHADWRHVELVTPARQCTEHKVLYRKVRHDAGRA